MTPKLVLLWTDVVLYAMVLLLIWYAWRVRVNPNLRANWMRVARDPAALCAGIVLALFALVTLVDSVHFRRALVPSADAPAGTATFYATSTESLLDAALARQVQMRESGYSEPLAYQGFNMQAFERDGQPVRDFPRLGFGGAHLASPSDWAGDVQVRAAAGAAAGLVFALLATLLTAWLIRADAGGWSGALKDIAADRTHLPLRAALVTIGVVCVLVGPVVALMGHYHVFGTDRTGNDVLYQALKSVRTAFVIGTLATVATLPLAMVLGVLAGYFKGWVDEVISTSTPRSRRCPTCCSSPPAC